MPEPSWSGLTRHALLAVGLAALLTAWRVLFSAGSEALIPVGFNGALSLCLLTLLGVRVLPVLVLAYNLAEFTRLSPPLLLSIQATWLPVHLAAASLLRRAAGRTPFWLSTEHSTMVFTGFALLVPVFTGMASLLAVRSLLPPGEPDYSPDNRIYLVLHWAREAAGLVTLGPILLVQVGPALRRWFDGTPPTFSSPVRVRDHWVELVFHTVLVPILLGLALWMKVRFGLSATCFSMLPLLAAARHGVPAGVTALAASTIAVVAVWAQLGWNDMLDIIGLRVLLLSGAVPVILTAAVVEQRTQARMRTEQLEAQFQALAARMEAVGDDERRSICTTIANDLRPGLIRLRSQILNSLDLLRAGQTVLFRSALESSAQSVDGVIHSVRRLATELRPGVLDSLGLDAAVEWLLKDFQARNAIPCRSTRLDRIPCGRELSTLYFRLLQDVLRAVRQEGRTKQVSVALEFRSPEAFLTIDLEGGAARLDVLALSERVESAGGVLTALRGGDGTIRILEARVACAEA